jgi:hypothetical protein
MRPLWRKALAVKCIFIKYELNGLVYTAIPKALALGIAPLKGYPTLRSTIISTALLVSLALPAAALPVTMGLPHLIFPQDQVRAPAPDRDLAAPLPGTGG